MYRFLLAFFTLTIVTSSFGQAELMGFRDYRDIADSFYMDFEGNDRFNIEDVKGSPFFNEEFNYGYIIDTKMDNKVQTFLRYDIYNDIFEIKLEPNDKSLKTLNRTPRFEYLLNDERFVIIQTSELNEAHYSSGNGYAVKLTSADNNAILYKRYYSALRQGKKAATSYQADIPPSISQKVKYIIKFGDEFKTAEDHRKRILDAFPDHKKEIRKYIKDKKFKFRGDDKEIQNQMIQVVRYYNSLVD
ncbi:hypothetical protein [Mesohalobacter halotolerans]|uniref:Uncharacterized protein n=1 Tax=Mesohalobacter halotolerans TaxID=1883405 RepID=A0A4U5TSP5_9FLAO|nr:hypothetical protein [Mesohalobacter halotolerans]MBS3738393.1 hypothetical protein [Psychroflexus sp.]TKS57339.1 hypothetical protein FCN74_02655 [Mesohalobacter halotolerans]